jgi:protease I
MADELSGRKVAILAADGVERVELEQPRSAVTEAGAQVELLSIHDGEIAARNHDLEDAGTFTVDGLVSNASVGDYDALLLPGGTVNPDQLRMNEDAVAFVRDFFESGKPIGTICHGPWTLVEAGVVAGREITSFPSRAHRPAKRGRHRAGPGGRRRRGARLEPEPGRPARVLREDRRGVRRGAPRRPHRRRGRVVNAAAATAAFG